MDEIFEIQGRTVQISHQISPELFHVVDTQANIPYLLKCIYTPSPRRLKCLQSELRLLRELCPHPNLVSLISYKETDEHFLILYEHCEGGSLECRRPSEPLKSLYHLALGLKHMHSRPIPVIHRNLTPKNIFEDDEIFKIGGLESSEEEYTNLLEIDLPLLEAELLEVTDEKWRPPELLELNEHSIIDCKIDVWNIGMIFYFMVFGVMPFPNARDEKEGKYTLPERVDEKIADLLGMMLNPNPLKRSDIDTLLTKLTEQAPSRSERMSCRMSCLPRRNLWTSKRSTATLIRKVTALDDLTEKDINVKRIIEKAWKTPKKIGKFYAEILRLPRLNNPQVRMKALLLIIYYLQDSPILVYHQHPGVMESLHYIEGYCSVRPGHPLKNDFFRRLTNGLAAVIKEKYYITTANNTLFNGRFLLNETNEVNLTSEQCQRLIEMLINYWNTVIKTHELLVEKTQLEQIRRSSRRCLIEEQTRLLDIIHTLYNRSDGQIYSAKEYMLIYHRAKALFEIDNQKIPPGIVPAQALPEILIEDPLDSEEKLASCSEIQEEDKIQSQNYNSEWNSELFQRSISDSSSVNVDETEIEDISSWEIEMSEVKRMKTIGKGSSSEVWLGLFQKTHVAVKELNLLDDKSLKEFRRELLLLIRLRHPNLVLLMGCSISRTFSIVMEFCGGGDLFHLLHRSNETFISWEQKLKILQDVAKGMHFLHHHNYIHRDLKSLNLLLEQPLKSLNDLVEVKISDFGLSKAYSEEMIMTGNLGTCHWMAPEILAGEDYSLKADVYSFAIVIYEVLTRKIPYSGYTKEMIKYEVLNNKQRPDLSFIGPDCPKSLKKLMVMCWRNDPSKRPPFSAIVDMLNATKVPIS